MKTRRGIDAEVYEVLAAAYAREGTDVDQREVGAYRTKTVHAGEFLYVSCYPLISAGANRRQREQMKNLNPDGMKRDARIKYARYNNKRRMLAFEQLVHANFGRGDFHVTLTYESGDWSIRENLPDRTRDDAKRELTNWLARVKRLLKRHGADMSRFRWLRTTVTKRGDGEHCDRHHHHVLLGGVPEELRSEIERLWTFGYCNADRLQPNEKGVSEIAQYIARQEGSANGAHAAFDRSWSGSRNLKRPAVATSDRRISRRRVGKIAADVRADGIEIFEAVYPGYRAVEPPEVMLSDFCAGAYIWAKMRRIEREGSNHDGTGVSGRNSAAFAAD